MYNNDSQTFLKISTKTCPAAWILHGDLQIKTTGNVYDSAQKQIHTQLAKNNCSAKKPKHHKGFKSLLSRC